MSRLPPALLIAALLLALVHDVAAEQHYFRRYTAADGLSQAVVQAIHQDSTGYLWIGTQAGLNRYDGAGFKIYGIEQGLTNDWINAIAEDAQGRIWLATLGGVSVWDGAAFQNFTTADGLADNKVAALVVAPDGTVWAATAGGVSRFDGARWRSYTPADGLPAAGVNHVIVDHRGRLWAGTSRGLAYLDGDRFVEFDAPGRDDRDVRRLTEDRQRRLWVGLSNSLRVYENDRLLRVLGPADGLTSRPITALHVDRHDVVWLATPQGLGAIRDGRVTYLTSRQGLRYADVRSLFEDREGLLWIGTYGGLYKFPGRAFTNYGTDDGLGSDSVRPIVRDRQGTLWVGTTGGLSRFDGRTWRTYTVADGLADNHIVALLEDRQGQLWIGTRTGLTIFDGRRLSIDPSLTPYGRTVSIVQDREGAIWCASQPGGLFRRRGGRFEPERVDGQSFSNGRLMVDRQGHVWASGDNGLSRWDGSRWRTYTTADGLADNQPYFMVEDRRGLIWFGYHSSRGLTAFDGTHFTHYTTAQGLANNAVFSLGVDRRDHLWIGTARGVDRFDGRTFTHYGTEEGYADNESNAGGFWADEDGTLWFGTVGGLSRYEPAFDLTGGAPPPVVITDILLGNRPFVASGPPAAVDHEHNDLHARVSVFSYVNEKRVDVEYRIGGFQRQWIALEGHAIHVPNLPAGRYTLEAKARKYQGVWTESVTFDFTVEAPFWQTWWFRLVPAVLLAASVAGGYRFQSVRARRRAEDLEQKVVERTRELTQKTEDLEAFLYTVSHDLKAPLISLQGLASLLRLELREPLSADTALYLDRINANTIHMQRLISELLQLSRIGRQLEPREPVCMKRLIGEVSAELHGQIHLQQATVSVADDLPTVTCEPVRLRQVWSNLLANALRYARPGVPPAIEVGVRNGNTDHYTFFMRDNGLGVAREHQGRLFDIFYRVDGKYDGGDGTGVGLSIVKRVIETHNGRVWVESEGKDRGSTFWFTLPKGPARVPPPTDLRAAAEPRRTTA